MSEAGTGMKKVLVTAVEEIPELGAVLGLMIDLLWEDDEPETWESIRERTEKLIGTALDHDASQRLDRVLIGLQRVMAQYRTDLSSDPGPADAYASYVTTRDILLDRVPEFQEVDHDVVLLPLFVQAANLHLVLLHGAVSHGSATLGMTEKQLAEERKSIASLIDEYEAYANTVYEKGLRAGSEDYVMQMTLDVRDYVDLWEYLRPGAVLPTSGPILTREIFSRAFGVWMAFPTATPSRGYYPPPPADTAVTELRIGSFADNNVGVDCVSVHYANGFATGWMGREPAHVKREFKIVADEGLKGLQVGVGQNVVTFIDGYYGSPVAPGAKLVTIPDGHFLSSVQVMSAFADADRGQLYNDVVRSVRFGFRFKQDVLREAVDGAALTAT